eukprot:gnl/TRDRNA2_/TRDRNA2_168764_c0_seq3.p1 gnl/TRDRNA2_/TRDRNA2_168764_c0~~gnl/TRDRNA2_/TRDRNA2_168764_c0_seq3.p1  ORF type:complete len:101 (+),score=16.80 gnl/TRDRNA2_/TRDRNA2_168764_c0_seq3:210-512(+)
MQLRLLPLLELASGAMLRMTAHRRKIRTSIVQNCISNDDFEIDLCDIIMPATSKADEKEFHCTLSTDAVLHNELQDQYRMPMTTAMKSVMTADLRALTAE